MTNIVLLMAGRGERFKSEGFLADKPFIKIGSKIMAEAALESLNIGGNARYTFAVRESFLSEYRAELSWIVRDYGASIVSFKETTIGAAATALRVATLLSPFDPVVFADTDNIYAHGVFGKFVRAAEISNKDAFLL
ncbi:MAG: hypothetical protein IJI37_00480, partial [Opitutales bacterium]|nr:hypothetical protein [Opitutales bacterium]